MKEASIRFGIIDVRGRRASTWKCWTHTGTGKSDVYLACRSLVDTPKASLHQSEEWHIAYSKEFFVDNPEVFAGRHDGRFIDKWRPNEIAPGLILAFRIITPYSAVNIPIATLNDDVVWIPVPPVGGAIEIDIFITSPQTFVSSWPGKNSMNTSLVDSILLDSGKTIWVVYRAIDCPVFGNIKGTARYFKGRSKDDLKGEGLRIIAFKREQDGSRTILDSALVKNK